MAAVVVELTGDEAKLLASMQKIIAQNAKTGDSFKETGKKAKESADEAVKEQQRVERENKKAAEAIYAEHQKMLDNKAKESKKAAQEEEALIRKTALAETKLLLAEADKKMAAVEKVAAQKRKAAEAEYDQARRSHQAAMSSLDQESLASNSRISGLVAAAAAYVGLNKVASIYTENLREQVDLQSKSLEKIDEIAKAQSGAVKNLTGLSTIEKTQALAEGAKIQEQIGFPSQARVVEAVGAGFSAGGNIAQTKDAVRASAAINRLTPDDLVPVVRGAIAIGQASGVADAKANLSYMLNVGSLALVDDPAKQATSIAPAVASVINTVPNQNKIEAAREAGAFFAELNKLATDTSGEATQTAEVTFANKLEEFFRKAPDEIQKLKAKIEDLDKKKKTTFGGLDENDKIELAKSQALLTEYSGLNDPGTFFGRMGAVAANPALDKEFFANDFGEAKFKGGFRKAVRDAEFRTRLEESKNAITFETTAYNRNLAELETISPEIRTANESARQKAEQERNLNNPQKALVATMRKKFEEVSIASRRTGIEGIIDSLLRGPESFVDPGSDSVEDNAAFFTAKLNVQQARAKGIALGPADQSKLDAIEEVKRQINEMAVRFAQPQSTEARVRELEAMDRNNKLLESIDSKIGGPGGNQVNAIRNQVEQAKGQ